MVLMMLSKFITIAPKYRRQIIYGRIKEDIGKILRDLLSRKIIRDKESEYIQTQVIYCDYRRLNKDPEYARTFPRTIEGKEYILKSDSHLWIMPFPREAVSNPGNGTITQNVEK